MHLTRSRPGLQIEAKNRRPETSPCPETSNEALSYGERLDSPDQFGNLPYHEIPQVHGAIASKKNY